MYETPFGFDPYVVWAQSFNPVYFSPTYGGAGVCGPLQGPARRDLRGRLQIHADAGPCDQRRDLRHGGKNRLSASPDPQPSSQIGQVRIRGAEIEVIGKVTPDLDVIASYSYINAKVERGDNVGKSVEGVPANQASLWGSIA